MDINIRANASFGFDPDKRVEKSENIEYYLDYLNDDGTSVLEREKFSHLMAVKHGTVRNMY